ncbi:hypothetical protein [Bacillus wiedmannii]|uniref:hypothetical protein n=1 Tax=Bacillus wiedmannii TaxID=1890302 RepID=UPI0014823951|nr:hypothetical protein [Bacillus wiedmannii]
MLPIWLLLLTFAAATAGLMVYALIALIVPGKTTKRGWTLLGVLVAVWIACFIRLS